MTALGDSFPETSVADPQDEQAIEKLMRFLEARIQKRDRLQEDVCEKQNHFRNILVEMERENASLRYDNNEQKKIISTLEGRVYKLQNHIDGLLYRLNDASDAVRNIQQELRNKDQQLKQHRLEKQKIIERCNIKIQTETDRIMKEMERKLQEQRERLTKYIKKKDDKMRLVRQILTSVREDTSDNITPTPIASSSRIETVEKINLTVSKEEPSMMTPIDLQTSKNCCGQIRQTFSRFTRSIPNNTHGKVAEESSSSLSKERPTVTFVDSRTSEPHGQICQTSFHAKTNSDNVQKKAAKESILMTESSIPSDSKTEISEEPNPTTTVDSIDSSCTIVSANTTIVAKTKLNTKVPVVNLRYQRMQNVDRWIDHRPTGIVPTGTILQPRTQLHKRTIRKLTNPKDFVTRSSRYCLLSQEQDADGELETKLYKADVLPTCGGGAQIVFNDIECLRQISPTATKKRNRQVKLENKPGKYTSLV